MEQSSLYFTAEKCFSPRLRNSGIHTNSDTRNDGVYEAMAHAEEFFMGDGILVKEIVHRIEEFTALKSRIVLTELVHEVMTQASGLYR
ncbi:MAG: hypothetical protein GX268_01750, partial [Methanomicrobiales archaeon]|nr:hypothetical protein [Methanomicrobiales archaeon]